MNYYITRKKKTIFWETLEINIHVNMQLIVLKTNQILVGHIYITLPYCNLHTHTVHISVVSDEAIEYMAKRFIVLKYSGNRNYFICNMDYHQVWASIIDNIDYLIVSKFMTFFSGESVEFDKKHI